MTNWIRWNVGAVEVTALEDGSMTGKPGLFPKFEVDEARAAARVAGEDYDGGDFTIPIAAFLVRSGEALVLVDTGSAPGFSDNAGHFPSALSLAGIDPGEITHIALTHMHPDHVGGLLDEAGEAAFPNAELVVGAADWAHFHSDATMSAANDRGKTVLERVRAAVAPYAHARHEIEGETDIVPGMVSVPLPGHTPGHTGYLLTDGPDQLLIWGDTIHCELFQMARPDWGVVFDVDIDQACETRARVFDRVVSEGLPICGPHVRFPGVATVERAGNGYRLIHGA